MEILDNLDFDKNEEELIRNPTFLKRLRIFNYSNLLAIIGCILFSILFVLEYFNYGDNFIGFIFYILTPIIGAVLLFVVFQNISSFLKNNNIDHLANGIKYFFYFILYLYLVIFFTFIFDNFLI